MTSFVQMLGTQPFFLHPQILIVHHGFYFLVNASENTQRLAVEYGIPITKVKDIFFSSISPQTFLGLPGFLLTLETIDSMPYVDDFNVKRSNMEWFSFKGPLEHCRSFKRGYCDSDDTHSTIPRVRLWGPPPLYEVFKHLTRQIAPIKSIQVEIHEVLPTHSPQPLFSLPFKTKDALGFQLWSIETQYLNKKRKLSCDAQNLKMSYTLVVRVVFPEQPGKLLMDKVAMFHIPRGPLLGKLKAGEPLQLDDGTWVHTPMVCDTPQPGGQILILDNPLCSWSNILKTIWIQSNQEEQEKSPSIIYLLFERDFFHIPQVPRNCTIISCLLQEFALECHPFPTSQLMLNLFQSIVPQTFCCILNDRNSTCCRATTAFSRYIFFPFSKRGFADSDWVLERKTQLQEMKSKVAHLDPVNLEECRELFQRAISVEQDTKFSNSDERLTSFFWIQFLGTGAAMPSKYRNVAGTLIQFEHPQQRFNILLDCGEGTLSQMILFSTTREAFKQNLKNLRVVFISHHHADHHLGLVSLLSTRHRFYPTEPPPLIYGPSFLEDWLSLWNSHIVSFPYTFVSCDNKPSLSLPSTDNAYSCTVHLQAIPVDHTSCYNPIVSCPYGKSYGVKVSIETGPTFTTKEKLHIVFSGDTRPCNALMDAAMDCHVLIHEATFEDALKEDAIKKRHSTFQEALSLGSACRAKLILLTHFSQRYPTIPKITFPTWNFAPMLDGARIPLTLLQSQERVQKVSQAFYHLADIFNMLRGV